MKIIRADQAGFCPGVRRAIEMAGKSLEKSPHPVYCLGPLIHNRQVMDEITGWGIKEIDSLENITEGTVIIRTHGVGPELFSQALMHNLAIVDATCPFVHKAQKIASELTDRGLDVIIVGDRQHPEVQGILAWTRFRARVLENPGEAKDLTPLPEQIGLIAQTTQPKSKLDEVARILKDRGCCVEIIDTICHATMERQRSALELARKVDVMVVVGGDMSANTSKLADICRSSGTLTYRVGGADELEAAWFAGKKSAGLTAGASTPDWIIEEVERKMSEFAVIGSEGQMQEVECKSLRQGEIVKGVVVQVGTDEVLVDVGAKSEGIIPLRELSCCEVTSPQDLVQVGDEIEVYVLKTEDEDSDGRLMLSKEKADAEKAWARLDENLKTGEPVTGTVREVVKGGLLVDIGVRAFLPASLVERGYVEELSRYLNTEISARVIELNRARKKVILSRKAVLDEEYATLRQKVMKDLQEGQIVRGVVRRITQFGAFVDIGGVDGLLHISEMAWYRVGHPSEIVQVGDELDVMILHVDQSTEKISLGLRQVLPNPWDNVEQKYPVEQVVSAKVVRLAPFGAFVQLEPGVEGLVHISHLADHHVVKPEDVVSEGEDISVKVLSVDPAEKRIRLSIREVIRDNTAAKFKEAPKQMHEAGDSGNVTLGDVFGNLFEDKGQE